LTPGFGELFLVFVGYPLCLVGACLGSRGAWKRERRLVSIALLVLSLLAAALGYVGATSAALDTTAILLMGIALLIPVATVVVVAILTFLRVTK
jgi:hypothetical protein